DEPVVLLQRRKDDRTAAREAVDHLVVAETPGEGDAAGDTQLRRQPFERRTLLALPGDDCLDAGAVGRGERADQQVRPLETVQPRYEQEFGSVAIAPIAALRRGRMEHRG